MIVHGRTVEDPATRKGPPPVPLKYAPYKELSIGQAFRAFVSDNSSSKRAFTVKNLEYLRYVAPRDFEGADIEHTTYDHLGPEKYHSSNKRDAADPHFYRFRRRVREHMAPFMQQGDAGPLAGILQRNIALTHDQQARARARPVQNTFPSSEDIWGPNEDDKDAMMNLFHNEFQEKSSRSGISVGSGTPIKIRRRLEDWWSDPASRRPHTERELQRARADLPRHLCIGLETVLLHANSATGFRGIMVASKWVLRKMFPWAKARSRPATDPRTHLPSSGTGPTEPLSPRTGWTWSLVHGLYKGKSDAYPSLDGGPDSETRVQRENRLFTRYDNRHTVEKQRDLAEALLFILATLATWNLDYANISGICQMAPVAPPRVGSYRPRTLQEHDVTFQDYPEHQSRTHLESMYDVAALARYTMVAIRYSTYAGTTPDNMQNLLLRLDPLASMHSRTRPPGWCPWAASQALIEGAKRNETHHKHKETGDNHARMKNKRYPSILEHLSDRVRHLQVFHSWHYEDWIISTYRTPAAPGGHVIDEIGRHVDYERHDRERAIDATWLSADMPHGQLFFDTVWMLHPLSHNFSVHSAEADAREHLLVELQYFALMMMPAYNTEFRAKRDLTPALRRASDYNYDGPARYWTGPERRPSLELGGNTWFPDQYHHSVYYRNMSNLLRDQIVEAHSDKQVRKGRHLTRCIKMKEWKRPGTEYAYTDPDPAFSHGIDHHRPDVPYDTVDNDSRALFAFDPLDKANEPHSCPWQAAIQNLTHIPWEPSIVNKTLPDADAFARPPRLPDVAARPAPAVHPPIAWPGAGAPPSWMDHFLYPHGQLLWDHENKAYHQITDRSDPDQWWQLEYNRSRYGMNPC